MDRVIIQGILATEEREPFLGQVIISKEAGLITEVIEDEASFQEADRTYGEDCLIFAGMGDIHIHAREDDTGHQNYKEDYTTSANAALNGGVVHVSAMPNTPHPLVTKEDLAWHRNRIKEINHAVSIFNYVGIGPGTNPLEETVPYKVYTGPSVGPLFFKSEADLREVIQHYRGQNVSFHVEDFDVLERCKDEATHTKRRPVECVETALAYVLQIIEDYNLKAKLCHWSTGGKSFEMIQAYRDRGCHITLEVSPLHLLFDADMLEEKPELWPYVQMNPAIQSQEHRKDLIESLRTGFIDYIATDHAPHTLDEKFRVFAQFKEEFPDLPNEEIYEKLLQEDPQKCKDLCCENGTSGAPWLDTYTLVATYLMKEQGFTSQDIARCTAKNPGTFVNRFLDDSYGKGFGQLKEGFQGSLTIMNTKESQVLERSFLKTKCNWSALEGRTFPGKLQAVIVRGEVFE